MSLDAGGGTQHLATVLPQALEHHLHGVLQETHKYGRYSQETQALANGFVEALMLTLKHLSSTTEEEMIKKVTSSKVNISIAYLTPPSLTPQKCADKL